MQDVVCQHVRQFYEMVQKIVEFQIVGENPKQTHDKLIGEITQFCDEGKEALQHVIAFLSSRKMEQIATEIDATVATAVGRLETETNRAKENNNAVEKKQAEMQEEFLDLKTKMQDQLAKESVSQYKAVFEDQARKYRNGARIWLGMGDFDDSRVRGSFILVTNSNIFGIRWQSTESSLARSLCQSDTTFTHLRVA